MEKKVMNTRLAVALLFGLLLAGQEAAAVGYDGAAPATETAPATKAAPATEASAGYAPATEAAPTTDAAAPASDAAAKATPMVVQSRATYGKGPAKCEVPGTCDVKAIDPTRPGAVANEYTRGCSKINGCRG